jgi:hypothetical protein
MGIILMSAAGVAMVAGALYLMLRINRAHERKIRRLREDWEASGRSEPWALGHWSRATTGLVLWAYPH